MELPLQKMDGEYIQSCVESHLDPENGTPYWLEKAEEYGGIDKAKSDIKGWKDLKKVFGLHTEERKEEFEEALRHRPYTDFIPKNSQDDIYIIGESGGTTGMSKRAPFTKRDWQDMLEKLDYILDEFNFPRNVDWLYTGPPFPPHGIGAYPRDHCRSRGGNIFGIDLDPRIMKEYGRKGMQEALGIYQKHIGQQIESILKSQEIGVMFTTSKILEELPKNMDVSRLNLQGIFHGGTSLSQETHRLFREEIYKDTPFTGGLGCGFAGVYGIQVPETENYEVVYVPLQPTHNLEVMDKNGEVVDYGERGRVATSKITEDFLMPAFLEDDEATLVEPPESLDNVDWPCVKDIAPIKKREEQEKGGVY